MISLVKILSSIAFCISSQVNKALIGNKLFLPLNSLNISRSKSSSSIYSSLVSSLDITPFSDSLSDSSIADLSK